jgi:sugar phosphate isomerase/epimerase
LPWRGIVSALLEQDYHGVLYVEHEDVLIPRRQGIAAALDTLRPMLPTTDPEGRTW